MIRFCRLLLILITATFLNGCLQSSAMLGPAYTMASTGNIYQAGLGYGSNIMIKKHTGKTTIENVKDQINNNLSQSNKINKDKLPKKYEKNDLFILVKSSLDRTSKLINSSNQ